MTLTIPMAEIEYIPDDGEWDEVETIYMTELRLDQTLATLETPWGTFTGHIRWRWSNEDLTWIEWIGDWKPGVSEDDIVDDYIKELFIDGFWEA